jgi:hypothetical protein
LRRACRERPAKDAAEQCAGLQDIELARISQGALERFYNLSPAGRDRPPMSEMGLGRVKTRWNED